MKKLVYCFFAMLLISCGSAAQTQQEKRPVIVDGLFSVQSDMISVDNGCYTINVRVYLTHEGQTLLIANSNVQIGDCPRRLGNNENPNCPDKEFKKDYFYGSKDKYKYCVVDLLEDEVMYAKYVIEKNRVINSFKK